MISEILKSQIDTYIEMIKTEAVNQNLVSNNTLNDIWGYHVEDSLQLASMISSNNVVMDVGSGAGFPGIIVVIHGAKHMHLVEPRKMRAKFLNQVVSKLSLQATVYPISIQQLNIDTDVIITRGTGTLRWLLSNTKYTKSTRFLAIKSSNFMQEIEDLKCHNNSTGVIKSVKASKIVKGILPNKAIPEPKWNFTYHAHELHRGIGYIVELTNVEPYLY